MKYIELLKKHNYSDDDIGLYIDAMFDLEAERILPDDFEKYVKTTYPGLVEAATNKDQLSKDAIKYLTDLVIR